MKMKVQSISEVLRAWSNEANEREDKRLLSAMSSDVAKQRAWDREIERRKRRAEVLSDW